MSDLQRILEDIRGSARDTLGTLCELFNASPKFKQLSERTQADYRGYRGQLDRLTIKNGTKLAELKLDALSTPFIQRLVDKIAESTPTKANHLLRYIRRVFSWGVQRGHCLANPAKGVEQAKERKLRRLPDPATMARIIDMAAEGARRPAHSKGSCPPYLWAVAEIAYTCRMRGIEVVTMTQKAGSEVGLEVRRRKGSRDNVTLWSPRLRAAWDALITYRATVWSDQDKVVPLRPESRPMVVSEGGTALAKSSLDSAWQRLMRRAVADGIITKEERFGLHDLKRRGITDTPGTRSKKQEASGHKNQSMLDVYDLSMAIVEPAGGSAP